MNARQRLLTALDGGEPDRVPCALGFYHVDLKRLVPRGQYRDNMVDVRFVEFPLSPEEKKLARLARPFAPDTRLGSAAQVATYARWGYRPQTPEYRSPLARARSLDDVRSFPFPDVSRPYHIEALGSQVRALHARGLAAGGNLPHLGGELFEAAWRLRGLENSLIDLLERPTWAHFLLDRLADLARRNAETLARAGVDVLALDDDVGMPGTMMISPATWREFFKPRLTTIIQAARAIKPDLRVLYHRDGYFEPIVGDLMEIGVNAINPLQPDHMDAVASANGSAASWRCGARWATTLLSALPHLTPSPGRSSTASRPWAAPGSSSVPPTTLTSRTSRGRTSPPSWKPSRRTVRTEQYLSPRRH